MVWAATLDRTRFAGSVSVMIQEPAEAIPRECHLRSQVEFTRLKARGRTCRGAHCLVVVESCPGERSKVAFVASKKGVGGAVERNRARRRLREIVRRRWSRVMPVGIRMMFVAFRSTLVAPHLELVQDVERLLVAAGAMTSPMER